MRDVAKSWVSLAVVRDCLSLYPIGWLSDPGLVRGCTKLWDKRADKLYSLPDGNLQFGERVRQLKRSLYKRLQSFHPSGLRISAIIITLRLTLPSTDD